MERQPEPDGARGPSDRPAVPDYESRVPSRRTSRGGGHWRGKVVVLTLILLGILLGVFGMKYRVFMPRKPATQPTSGPVGDSSSSRPS